MGGDPGSVEAIRERANVVGPRGEGLASRGARVVVRGLEAGGDRREGLLREREEAFHAGAGGLEQARGAGGRFRGTGHRGRLASETAVCLGAEDRDIEVTIEAQDIAELPLEHVVVAERAVVQERQVQGGRVARPAAAGREGAAAPTTGEGAAARARYLVGEYRSHRAAPRHLRSSSAGAVAGDQRVLVGRGGADEVAGGPDGADPGLRLRAAAFVAPFLGAVAGEPGGVGGDRVETPGAREVAPRPKGRGVAVPGGGGETRRDHLHEFRRERGAARMRRTNGVLDQGLRFREEALELAGAAGASGQHGGLERVAVAQLREGGDQEVSAACRPREGEHTSVAEHVSVEPVKAREDAPRRAERAAFEHKAGPAVAGAQGWPPRGARAVGGDEGAAGAARGATRGSGRSRG